MSYDGFKPVIFGRGKLGKPTPPLLVTQDSKDKKKQQTPSYELINGIWHVKAGGGRYLFESYERLVCGLCTMEFLGLVPEGTTEGLRK